MLLKTAARSFVSCTMATVMCNGAYITLVRTQILNWMINLELDCLLDHYIHVPQVLPRSIHLKAQKGHFMEINKKSCLPRDPLRLCCFSFTMTLPCKGLFHTMNVLWVKCFWPWMSWFEILRKFRETKTDDFSLYWLTQTICILKKRYQV